MFRVHEMENVRRRSAESGPNLPFVLTEWPYPMNEIPYRMELFRGMRGRAIRTTIGPLTCAAWHSFYAPLTLSAESFLFLYSRGYPILSEMFGVSLLSSGNISLCGSSEYVLDVLLSFDDTVLCDCIEYILDILLSFNNVLLCNTSLKL